MGCRVAMQLVTFDILQLVTQFLKNIQPLYADLMSGGFAYAHNGNLTNASALREKLVSRGSIFQSTSDTETILQLVAQSEKANS